MYQRNTKLSITIEGDGSELFDYSLPHPLSYSRNGNKYTLIYALNGYFNTKSSYDYLNDIIARFTLSMRVLDTNISSTHESGIELSLFRGLKSIQRSKNYERVDVGQDNLFWSIKLYTEALIKESGEGNMIAYSLIESFAFSRFIDRAKDKSTLRAKCRRIWNWYDERDWTIPKRYERDRTQYYEDTKMTRTENMHKINAAKVDRNYKKVVNLLTGLFNDAYKKKNGAWHILKISEELSMSRNTVSKYIKEFENEK